MRRLSFFFLLATAAAPTSAAVQDEGDRRAERRAARQAQASEESEARPERAPRIERRQERQERRSDDGGFARTLDAQGEDRPEVTARSGENESVRNWRRAEREARRDGGSVVTGTQDQSGTLMPRQRRIRTIPDPQQSVTDQAGQVIQRHRRDYRDGNYSRWSRDSWRHDRRYDWRRHRDRHRSLFRLGFYYDPFGWNYRRYDIGWRLYPSYYGSRYWLNDPWHYRLPAAYGPYRWVRYWDDALLVNIYTGEVVDVIHSFFW